MDVSDWLQALGLERYETAFRENDISAAVLPSLTAEDLKELGVASVGHRRQLLEAIGVRPSWGGSHSLAVPPCCKVARQHRSQKRTPLHCNTTAPLPTARGAPCQWRLRAQVSTMPSMSLQDQPASGVARVYRTALSR
jgi:hypothetical protein